MTIAAQVITLIAVVVGAITSFIATSLSERRRFQREQAQQWTDRKLESYAAYLECAKEMNQLSRRIAAARGIGKRVPELAEENATQLLAEAEARRANASERVNLIGDAATVAAIRELNKEVWRLEWIARGKLTPDDEEWESCNQSLVRALNLVHQRIREELRIPGRFLPRAIGEPYEPSLPVSLAIQESSSESEAAM
jgi:uncharacterized membrane protein YccC